MYISIIYILEGLFGSRSRRGWAGLGWAGVGTVRNLKTMFGINIWSERLDLDVLQKGWSSVIKDIWRTKILDLTKSKSLR